MSEHRLADSRVWEDGAERCWHCGSTAHDTGDCRHLTVTSHNAMLSPHSKEMAMFHGFKTEQEAREWAKSYGYSYAFTVRFDAESGLYFVHWEYREPRGA
jgi:hypothetical protein